MADFLAIALSESQQGRRVFPLSGKVPAIPKDKGGNGCLDATTDEVRIVEWAAFYPDCNVGIGFFDDSPEIGLDVDTDNLPIWQAYEKQYGLIDTRLVATGGGGWHYYFLRPPGIALPNISKFERKGFELKSNVQYLVAPGSVHPVSGKVYELVRDINPQPLPDWLVKICLNHKPTGQAKTADKKIPVGERNSYLFRIGSGLRAKGMSFETISATIRAAYGNDCDQNPPMDDKELTTIATQAAKYEQGKPSEPGNTHKRDDNEPTSLKVVSLSEVQASQVSWLWKPYIPLGKFSLLEGDPGVGKSWVTLAIATAVSNGIALPGDTSGKNLAVLIASAEDGLSDTIKPRLAAMGANTSEIHAIDGLFTLNDKGFEMLEAAIIETFPGLIIIDPLVAYLSGEMDINKANQVRHATSRLAALAEKYNTAILAVRHLTKGGSQKAIYRGLGSIDFTAAARSVLMAGADPDDLNIRGIVHIKSNLAPLGEARGYELKPGASIPFAWTAACHLTAEKIMGGEDTSGSSLQEAVDMINDMLSGGPVPATDIFTEGESRGLSEATIKRAKSKMKIHAYREGTEGVKGGGRWWWEKPKNED
ncbi:MAG: AAA family ATPase [Chloroflexi bacterium]|nr:AAA family ATPase [Chloroflexota bacterium]